MIGLIFFGVSALASAVIGGMYYVKQDNKRWQREFAREDLFNKIKGYGHDF